MPEREQPGLLRTMREDLGVVVERDPSVRNRREALLHPALPALWTHRVAHRLHRRGRRLTARMLARAARRATGSRSTPAPNWAAGSSSTTVRPWSSARPRRSVPT